MRVLHLIKSEGVYGAERILLYLAREQQRAGHDVHIGSIAAPGEPTPDLEDMARRWQLPVLSLRVPRLPTPRGVRTLLAASRGVQAQVLHSHGFKANVLLGPLPHRLRPPLLATLHGWTAAGGMSRLALYEALDRLALRRIDSVVVVTRSMLALPAVRALRAERVHVIENGVPARGSLEEPEPATASEVSPKLIAAMHARPTLLAVGRLSPEKGFDDLLAAFASARGAQPHQLLIVGTGPQEEQLRRRIAGLQLGEHVKLAGYVEGAERLLKYATGFVMSSRTEGMPLVLLEAIQWGTPVVATAVGAIPELLAAARGGELVTPGDPAALAAALRRLMSGAVPAPDNADIRRRFSSARMAQEYLDAYRAIT